LFPTVEISKGPGTIQLGSERSSVANELDQDIFEVTNNVRIFKGKHTFTIGTHNEFFKFRNLFINNVNGRWSFASIDDFYRNNPRQVQVTYARDTMNPRPSAAFSAAQLGFYAQDEWQASPNLRITAGIRVDVPVVGDKPGYNKAIDSTFNGQYNTENIPNKQLLWSPRVGFNYDVKGDRSIIIRGGAGIFTGRVPFVWISNQFTNTGNLFNTINVSDDDRTPANELLVRIPGGFEPNVANQRRLAGAQSTFEANIIDKNFKIPQVARFNLATDLKLPGGIIGTFEGMYSKTINNVLYTDVNLADAVGTVDPWYNNGADTRIAYAGTSGPSGPGNRRKNPLITNAILLSNTNLGYTYNLTAQFSRTWKNCVCTSSL
jgi:hypothetical protein